MKKILRKYQFGSQPSYTGFSSGLSTTPKLTTPTFSSNPAISQPTRYTSQFSETPEKPASNVGGTIASAASGIAGSVISGISTANSAQANIDAAKRAKAKRDEAKRNIAAFKLENINNPDAVREYTQMQNSTYNREDASLDVGRMQSEAQEEISKNTTIAATSAIPVVGPLISGLTALTWGLLGDAEEEQYQASLNRRKTKTYNNVGGTSEETRPDSMFAKYGGRMDMIKYGKGGYTVTKSDDSKGKTHKVTGPDGSVKYFGDPNMGERSESKYGEEAFYARHKSNLENNPHFRAYARATWKDGGIYIDPAKKGTFKAQATRMDMGVQEAASKILNAPEGEYSPKMRRKANFAQNFAKRDGGMIEYKKGGMHYSDGVQIKNANAELEGGEIIMKNGGKRDVKVNGPSHEQGGVPMKLKSGDFVWSRYLKDKGKSMAELYLMVKDNPEKVNQLKDLQEDLASKEEPSEYNDLPQAKCGGGLPKYQKGTPFNMVADAEKEAAAYNAAKRVNKSSVPIVTPEQIKAAGFTNLRDYLNAQRGLTRVGGAPAQVPVVTAPITAPAAAYNPNGPLATYASVNGPGYGMNGPLTDYASVYGPGVGYTNASVEETGKTQRAVGEKSKTDQFLGKYGPSIAAGLGGVGQLFALGLAENPYENLSVPNAAQLSSAQFTALGRNNDEAFKNAAMSGYRALLDDARYRGAGPGDMSQGQMAYNRAMQEIEAAQRGVMASNINLAATEAELNQSNNLEVKKFNAAAKNAQIENELALNSARASFEGQKPGLIAGAIGTTVSDGLNFYKDQEKAKAIYENTSLEKDHYGVDMQAINKKAWQVAEEKAKAAGKTATYADYYKEVSGLLDLLPKQ